MPSLDQAPPTHISLIKAHTHVHIVVAPQAESVELEEDGEEEEGEGAQAAGSGQEELVEWVVSGSDGAMPLDVVLARRFPELSRRVCRKLLQADKVRVNGQGNNG